MEYNKSEDSKRYNKEERGGWYCTNPKKHDEGNMHHGANEPHEHRAERNDQETQRQPEARINRTPPTPPLTDSTQKKNSGCRGCMIYLVAMFFILKMISKCNDILSPQSEILYEEEVQYYDLDSEDDDAIVIDLDDALEQDEMQPGDESDSE